MVSLGTTREVKSLVGLVEEIWVELGFGFKSMFYFLFLLCVVLANGFGGLFSWGNYQLLSHFHKSTSFEQH